MTRTSYPAHWEMPSHSHPYSNVSIVIRGHLQEETSAHSTFATACSVVIKPGDTRHKNCFGPQGATLLSIQPGYENRFYPGKFREWTWIHAGSATGEVIQLLHCLRKKNVSRDELLDAIYSFLAALPDNGQHDTSPPHWLIRVRDTLEDNPAYPHRVAELAEEIGTHPVYLARVFKRHFHQTITEYLRSLRLRQAIDQLASSGHPLAEIAHTTGFADQSHLGRLFKSEFRITPNRFRELVEQID